MSATFGDRLRELRLSKGLRQIDLCEILNVSKSAVGAYERNEREPVYKQLMNLADYFNVSLDYLLGRSDEPLIVEQYIKRDIHDLSEILDKYELKVQDYRLTEEDKQRIKHICLAVIVHKLKL